MRTQKAMRNVVFSTIYQICSVICGLITPRLILSAFGSSYNGVISSATQFLEMISLLTLGIAGATRVALYKPLAEADTLAISRIMKSNKIYMRKVGFVVVLYSTILCIVYPLVSHNSLKPHESAALIAIVSVGTFAQYYFGISNQTLLAADQSVYIYHAIGTMSVILNTLIAVALINLGCTIFVVKIGSACVFFLSPILLNLFVKRKYGLIENCIPDDTAIRNRGVVAFHSIANIVHEDTDLIVLTLFVDAKEISVYAVYQLIIGKVRRMLLMYTTGLEGAFGNMWAKGEKESFYRNFRFYEFIIFFFTSIIFSCVATLVIPFVKIYTQGITDVNYIRTEFAFLTVITEAIYCVRHPYIVVVQSTGNYEGTKKAALLEAIINIVISLVLVNFMGLSGVMIGTLVANIFRTIQYSSFVSNNILKGSFAGSAKSFFWFVLNSVIAVIIQSVAISVLIDSDGWRGWIISGLLSVFIACLITVVSSFLFYKNDMIRLIGLMKVSKFRGRRAK